MKAPNVFLTPNICDREESQNCIRTRVPSRICSLAARDNVEVHMRPNEQQFTLLACQCQAIQIDCVVGRRRAAVSVLLRCVETDCKQFFIEQEERKILAVTAHTHESEQQQQPDFAKEEANEKVNRIQKKAHTVPAQGT